MWLLYPGHGQRCCCFYCELISSTLFCCCCCVFKHLFNFGDFCHGCFSFVSHPTYHLMPISISMAMMNNAKSVNQNTTFWLLFIHDWIDILSHLDIYISMMSKKNIQQRNKKRRGMGEHWKLQMYNQIEMYLMDQNFLRCDINVNDWLMLLYRCIVWFVCLFVDVDVSCRICVCAFI